MSKSSEMTLINNIASQFNASVRVKGFMYRGGFHTLKLREAAPNLKSTKKKIRAALTASGFRMQGSGMRSSPEGLSFYVIRGGYNEGQLALIELDGTPAKPELWISFGG